MENDILSGQFLNFPIISFDEVDDIINKCQGSNQKKLLVVFQKKDEHQDNLEFLKKILAAAKFNMDNDILLLSITEQESFSFISMRTKAAIENLLVFGVAPPTLGIHLEIPKYQPTEFNGSGFLFADGLQTLGKSENKHLKGALWKAMQVLFKL